MQFPWTPWKKTRTKIKVAYRCLVLGEVEEMVLSYDGKLCRWISYRPDLLDGSGGSKFHKRHSRISSERWKRKDMSIELGTTYPLVSSEYYRILEVDLDTILEIYDSRKDRLKNLGLPQKSLIGGYIE